MAAEIHRITKVGPVLEPDTKIIEVLEDLLARAKDSKIKSLAYAITSSEDFVSWGWVQGCGEVTKLVAGTGACAYDVMQFFVKED